jgi:hypothetical protein
MIVPNKLLSTTAGLMLLTNAATCLALALPTDSTDTKALETRSTYPVSVVEACITQHGKGFSAQTTGNGCNDWVCVRGNERYGVDIKRWCWGVTDDETPCGTDAFCNNGVFSWVCSYTDEGC